MMHILFYEEKNYQAVIDYLTKAPENVVSRSEFATHLALSLNETGKVDQAHETLSELVSKGCINAGFTKYELHRLAENKLALSVLNDSTLTMDVGIRSEVSRKWIQIDSILTKRTQKSNDARLVSVIMTAHKMNPMMDAAVSSILNQTHQNLELLIIDDASPEADVELYEQYAARDSRIRLIRQEVNSGTYSGRNRGISEAKGEFISFADSDDWQHPQKFEMALNRLDANPDAIATLESYIRLNHEGRKGKLAVGSQESVSESLGRPQF